MNDRDIFSDYEAIKLMKHLRVGNVGLAAVAFADIQHFDVDGFACFFVFCYSFFNLADLAGCSVGGEDNRAFFWIFFFSGEECFPVVSCWVVIWKIERGEGVVVPFNFGVADFGEANFFENVGYLFNSLSCEMEVSERRTDAGFGDV